jgi:hypothetical protein
MAIGPQGLTILAADYISSRLSRRPAPTERSGVGAKSLVLRP